MNFFKKKIVYIPLCIIGYLILLGSCTKFCGILTMIGAGGLLYYLFCRNKEFKAKNKTIKSITTIGLIILFLFGLGFTNADVNSKSNVSTKNTIASNTNKKTEEKAKQIEIQNKKETEEKTKQEKEREEKIKQEHGGVTGELKIHYIDVGQADSILIQQGDKSMLIDAGNNDDSELVKSYIEKQGITALNYVVGTHPHEDHIGGLDYVINSFNIGNVFMPKKLSTTNTFKDVINAVKCKGLQITSPQVGQSYELGEAKFTILGPKQEYENINDNSIIIKMTFGNNSFLFTGDAEGTSEMDMVKAGLELKSDVIKVGHHGSKTSTVVNFLEKVQPTYAVVSVGKDNTYKHPSQGVMDRLKGRGTKVYRTDENGTIILNSNGKDIEFNCQPGSYKGYAESTPKKTVNKNSNVTKAATKSNTNRSAVVQHKKKAPVSNQKKAGTMVWLSATGEKYHSRPNCGRMNPNRARQVTKQEAESSGYYPCSKCY